MFQQQKQVNLKSPHKTFQDAVGKKSTKQKLNPKKYKVSDDVRNYVKYADQM